MIEFGDLNGISPESNPLHGSTGGEMLAPLIRQIPVGRIVPDPDQPRRCIATHGPEWDGLVASVREFGIVQPIAIRPRAGRKGEYVNIFGERRWRVAEQLGLTHIPAKIIKNEALIARRMELQMMENALRVGLAPLDELEACKRVVATTGMEKQALAKLLGVTPALIAQIFKLDGIAETIRAEIRSAGFRLSRRQHLRIAQHEDPEDQRRTWEEIRGQTQGADSAGKGAPTTTVAPGPPAAKAARPRPNRTLIGRDYHCSLRLLMEAHGSRREKKAGRGTQVKIRNAASPEDAANILRRIADELAGTTSQLAQHAEESNHAA